MAYQIRLINRAEREAKIHASIMATRDTQDFYDFRNQKTQLKVIRVELALPIYRMENFRAFTEQKEYTIRERKPFNYFQAGQENESVQQLQHEILAKLARTGRTGSITPVIDVLRKEKQRDSLLITHAGVVINGNRRLAAMRELYEEDAGANAAFSYVTCIVLPEDTTPDEIVDIEAALQAKPETRLDYDWIGDCQLINKLLSLGRKPAEVADRLNRKDKEIKNSLLALAEAEMYLKDWVKAEGEYSRVRDAEQFFKDLPELLRGKDPELQDGSRVIAWTLYENRDKLGDRLYAFNTAFGKRAADVLDRVASDLGVPLENKGRESLQEGFEVAIEEEEGAVSYEPVIDALRDPQRRGEAVETLIEACQGVLESDRTQKSANAALRAVTGAHSKLLEVDLSRAAAESYTAIDKQLDAIVKKATELRGKLAKYRAEGSGEASISP